MCQKAASTAAGLMAAIKPTLLSLLSFVNLADTTDGEAVINAFTAAENALASWQSGSPAQNVIALMQDFQTIFSTLPLPTTVISLTNIILAGIETVIGVLTANSPVPVTTTTGTATPEESQAMFQAHVAATVTSKVTALVPGFHRSIWHSAASQYKKAWDNALKSGGFPESMKA